MKIKHTLSSQKDKKPTILNTEIEKFVTGKKEITLVYESKYGRFFISYEKTRNGTTWYAKNKLPPFVQLPQVGKPVELNITGIIIQDELF